MAIMAVRRFFLPAELVVDEADKVPHYSSSLPDPKKVRVRERVF